MFAEQALELTVPPGEESLYLEVELQRDGPTDAVLLGKSQLQPPADSPRAADAEQQLSVYPSLGSNLPHAFVVFIKSTWLD